MAKNQIVICDCIDCPNKPTWKQGFYTRQGIVIIDLCEDHHLILRTKVPNYITLDEEVLKWLLIQDHDMKKVKQYGLLNGTADIHTMEELTKIELEYE